MVLGSMSIHIYKYIHICIYIYTRYINFQANVSPLLEELPSCNGPRQGRSKNPGHSSYGLLGISSWGIFKVSETTWKAK